MDFRDVMKRKKKWSELERIVIKEEVNVGDVGNDNSYDGGLDTMR